MTRFEDEHRRSRRIEYATKAQRRELEKAREARGDLTFFECAWRIFVIPPLAVLLAVLLHVFFSSFTLIHLFFGAKIFLIALFCFVGVIFVAGFIVAGIVGWLADKLVKILKTDAFLRYFSVPFFPLILFFCALSILFEFSKFPDAPRVSKYILFFSIVAEFASAVGIYYFCKNKISRRGENPSA